MGKTTQPQWPSQTQLDKMRDTVSEMFGFAAEDIRVVGSPYRICPLGAHIDHQGGTVTAMTINKGILLGFVPSGDAQVVLRSGQFKGEVRFRVDEIQEPRNSDRKNGKPSANGSSEAELECQWGSYVRGAVYALQSRGYQLSQGITGYICGCSGLDSSGLSSSAAVGVAYLLALESANNLTVSPTDNIEYDRVIENEYFGLRNGILDQSAILLSRHGCLTYMNCKTKEHELIHPTNETKWEKSYRILLAFSGLKQNLTTNPGYNRRVTECQEAARILLQAAGVNDMEPILSNVDPEIYEAHKSLLEPHLAKRAEHYFSENMRVVKGAKAWALGNWDEFGQLISASGLSSIQSYECGCEPMIQLYEILLRTPGILGARFSGAGFRGCCLAFVDANHAEEAAQYVRTEYANIQPDLASHLDPESGVLICEAGDSASVF